jgi:hypothetical protein
VIAVARASIFTQDKADLRDLDVAGVTGSPVAAIVAMSGEPEALAHLPAAYLDEILLRDRKSDAEDRLREMRTRIAEARSQLDSDPKSALGPINLFEHVENAEPFAQVETKLHATFRTTTSCRPRRRLGYVLDAAFWAYWNWLLVESNFEADLTRSLLENLELQLETYGTQGLSMRHAGKAVRHAMDAGASARLRTEQESARGETSIQELSGNSRVADIADALAEHASDRLFDETGQSEEGATAYSDKVLEGMRLAAAYDVDLVELANSIIAQVSEAHAQSATGRVWFPAEAIRALCCMEFLVAAGVSDPRLDEAFMRSAQSPSEEATTNVSEIGQRVIDERGLGLVIDALLELIRDQDAPPASELL